MNNTGSVFVRTTCPGLKIKTGLLGRTNRKPQYEEEEMDQRKGEGKRDVAVGEPSREMRGCRVSVGEMTTHLPDWSVK